jgi:PhnB protein
MTMRLNPYLSFDGTAREAMEFYAGVFGGELTLSTFGEFADPSAPGADKIMHGMLHSPEGYTLMGADNPPGMPYVRGNSMSISLSGDDETALRAQWEQLSEGAEVSVPLEKQMWGDIFGMCTDRFGVAWMVNIAG